MKGVVCLVAAVTCTKCLLYFFVYEEEQTIIVFHSAVFRDVISVLGLVHSHFVRRDMVSLGLTCVFTNLWFSCCRHSILAWAPTSLALISYETLRSGPYKG